MKRLLLFIVFINVCFYTEGQNLSFDNFFNKSADFFIDTTINTHEPINKYVIYTMHVDGLVSKQDTGICIMTSYIVNSFHLRYIKSQYFIRYKNEIILVNFSNDSIIDYFSKNRFLKITKEDSIMFFKKLYPESIGGFTGSSQGMVSCILNKEEESKFYYRASDIPMFYNITSKSPKVKIELLKDVKSLKKSGRSLRVNPD